MNELVKEGNTSLLMRIDSQPCFLEEIDNEDKYIKLNTEGLRALGTSFEPISQAISTAMHGSGSGLYRVTVPEGCHLAQFKNGAGNLGAVLNQSNQVSGQAVLNPIAFNPAMICVAASIMVIEKKMDCIQEMQEDILHFLKDKERAKHEANLEILSAIVSQYRFNWDNKRYRDSNNIKVVDINQEALQGIKLYKKQVERLLKAPDLLHSDVAVKTSVSNIQKELQNYQLALYTYAFSLFVQIIMTENYETQNLKNVKGMIEDKAKEYQSLYDKCYEKLDKDAMTSVESALLGGLAGFNSLAGKAVANVPILKENNVDGFFLNNEENVKRFNSKKKAGTLEKLTYREDNIVEPFTRNITAINKIYNEQPELIVGNDALYIAV